MFSTFLAFAGDREAVAAVASGRPLAREARPGHTPPSWSPSATFRPLAFLRPLVRRRNARRAAALMTGSTSPDVLITGPWFAPVPDFETEPARAC